VGRGGSEQDSRKGNQERGRERSAFIHMENPTRSSTDISKVSISYHFLFSGHACLNADLGQNTLDPRRARNIIL